MPLRRRRRRTPVLALVALSSLVVALVAAACGSEGASPGGTSPDGGDRPTIVVTHSVLGAVVAELVGDAADVEVLIPDGADPHDHRPSARDVEALSAADLVVANGLGLEASLEDAIDQAEADGVPVFRATDHVALRSFGDEPTPEGEAAHEGEAGHAHDEATHDHEGEAGQDHEHGAEDPHVWVDPLAVREVVLALAGQLEADLGLDVAAGADELAAELVSLDAEARQALEAVPPERRLLVTGHESMGYFADRYGFELVGALIPATTSQAAAAASALAELATQVEELGVPVVFNEVGTPPALADAIAEQTGAHVVELPTHALPEDGTYAGFVREIVERIVAGLAP